MDRDTQIAELIRREIAKLRARAQAAGWAPYSMEWHRAFGEISGFYRVLELICRDPYRDGEPRKDMHDSASS